MSLIKKLILRNAKWILPMLMLVGFEPTYGQGSSADRSIQSILDAKLKEEKWPSYYEVRGSVSENIATLSGKVNLLREKKIILDTAKEIYGIRSVIDKVEVAAPTIADGTLNARVKESLEKDPFLKTGRITTQASNGKVILAGSVDSAAQKDMASWKVMGIQGVRDVEDLLYVSQTVGKPSEDETQQEMRYKVQKKRGISLSNHTLEKAVNEAIRIDPRVKTQVSVKVQNKTAVLTGTVNKLAEKLAAENSAFSVVGINQVKNDIQVQPVIAWSDSHITEEVRNLLIVNPRVNSNEIDIGVHQGVVSVVGWLDSDLTKENTIGIISNINGVRSIQDHLEVLGKLHEHSESWMDRQLKEKIQLSMGVGGHFTYKDSILVSVQGQVATLEGVVKSDAEKMDASRIALENGAKGVENRLAVSSQTARFFTPRD